MVLLVVGAVGATAYGSSADARLAPGERLTIGAYKLELVRVERRAGPNYQEVAAVMKVRRDGADLGLITPARRVYAPGDRSANEAAIRTDWGRGEDLFVRLQNGSLAGDGAGVEALVNPAINLLWLSGLLFLAGVFVVGWPDRRSPQRSLTPEAARSPV